MPQHKIIIWIISISCVLVFLYDNKIDSKIIAAIAWLIIIIGYFNVKSSYIRNMRIKQEKISKKNPFDDSDDYSLFISYSSKNAHIARLVAETMLANRLLGTSI